MKEYKEKRITVRVTMAEWHMLKDMCRKMGFHTTATMLRCFIWHEVRDFDRMLADAARAEEHSNEVEEMFCDCEQEGKQRAWGPDVNQRR